MLSRLSTTAWLLFAVVITFACVHEAVSLWSQHIVLEVR